MTPLAHRIVKELTLPLKKRTFMDRCGLLSKMDDIHCFDVTEVRSLGMQMWDQMVDHGPDSRATFLPAPKTWIEFAMPKRGPGIPVRVGWLLEEVDDGARTWLAGDGGSAPKEGWIGLRDSLSPVYSAHDESTPDDGNGWLYAFLAFINSPRMVGRRQHMPHRGLERALVAQRPMIGKFPLNAWTEIKLEVAPPVDMREVGSTEAHYTGAKALHFCRAHLRIRRGKLEVVRGHWRGDPALGIKQSRYTLKAPRVAPANPSHPTSS